MPEADQHNRSEVYHPRISKASATIAGAFVFATYPNEVRDFEITHLSAILIYQRIDSGAATPAVVESFHVGEAMVPRVEFIWFLFASLWRADKEASFGVVGSDSTAEGRSNPGEVAVR